MQLKLTHINPNFIDVVNHNRNFIESFMTRVSNKYKQTFLTMLSNPIGKGYSQPLISAVLSNIVDILNTTSIEHNDIEGSEIIKFCNMFVNTSVEILPPALYYIPKYNMYHYGNICHFNTCILMLASMYYFIEALANVDTKDIKVKTLLSTLLNTYSQIDMNPITQINLIKYTNVNIHNIEPAEETMIKLLNIIEGLIDTDILIHWDFAHSTLKNKADTDLNVNEIVNKYTPLYLLVNAQDFSVALEVPQNNQFIPLYSSGEHEYKLASVILYHSHHFINVFINNEGNYIVKDDICHRLATPGVNLSQLHGNIQVTELCYVKIK